MSHRAKEVYEQLAVLHQQCAGTLAEASLDHLVDTLLRVAIGGCSQGNDKLRAEVVQGIVQYQKVYVPIRDPEDGK